MPASRAVVRTVVKCAPVVGLALAILVAWVAYRPVPAPSRCADLPARAIVLVPGYWHAGRVGDRIASGPANMRLADALEQCSDRISLVLTQEAVSQALVAPSHTRLRNGVPVEQMHADDPAVNVRTYAALKAALERLDSVPDTIVLLAHPRHLERARAALASLYSGRIVLWHTGEIGRQCEAWCAPISWALWNAVAGVHDAGASCSAHSPRFDRLQRRVGLFQTEVPTAVRLPKLRVKEAGQLTQ